MNKLIASIASFARDEEGAQVVEYALIIALVSIALAGLLATAFTGGTENMFQGFVDRVAACLSANGCPAAGA